MLYDLHAHTTASDGTLTPAELVERAVANGVTDLAITDHDTLGGIAGLATRPELRLIPGIELSTRWLKTGIHVVGLRVDPENDALRRGVARQQAAREDRARRIAARLERLGIEDPLPAVRQRAAGASIGRPHFAAHLVEIGRARDHRQAFRRYLGAGKPANVRVEWASLDEVIGWIRGAGGDAVLAHPAHYRLTRTKLRALVADFREAGGTAIEVVSGRQDEATGKRLAELAAGFGLAASQGSDFHRPGTSWSDVGRMSPMPAGCRPVWAGWS